MLRVKFLNQCVQSFAGCRNPIQQDGHFSALMGGPEIGGAGDYVRLLSHIFLIEPLVETVLDARSGGLRVEESAFVALRSTDDQNWSIGYAHFVQNGVPYRMTVQFSNSYGAITAVTVSRGYSEVDAIYASLNPTIRSQVEDAEDYPYYTIALATASARIKFNQWKRI